jgi:predicted nucleotidyltransferase
VPIFRSDLQGEVLYAILTSPDALTIPKLVDLTGRPQPSVHREVTRLASAGFVKIHNVGRSLLISANETNPATPHLRGLVLVTLGPTDLLRKALRNIPGVHEALIFGSWAARAAGEPGPAPGDIDLLVVGNPPRTDVYAAASEVEAVVRREVNVTLVSEARWAASDEPFLREVRSRPTISLVAA